MVRSKDVQEDDVGARPRRTSAPAGSKTLPAPAPVKCEPLFELFRGGAGAVLLGRLRDGGHAPQLVALRRLANLPTRELEAAIALGQRVVHPRLSKVLGSYQHEDAWYLASEYVSGVTLFELGQTAVRAAAVELARLACGRLMNGNPASWQTPELPQELSELLTRAINRGTGADTLAAFARALAALDPRLIAEPEAVQ